MRLQCTASLALKKFRLTDRIRSRAPCTCNWNYDRVGERHEAMKRMLLLLVVALAASASFAADGKSVSYKSGDETVQGLLYTPHGKGPFPAIIVIHEWWGLNDWIKDQASKLAEQGYEALAIDLYRGKVATTADTAHELMRGGPDDRANRDLEAAFNFLQSQPNVK